MKETEVVWILYGRGGGRGSKNMEILLTSYMTFTVSAESWSQQKKSRLCQFIIHIQPVLHLQCNGAIRVVRLMPERDIGMKNHAQRDHKIQNSWVEQQWCGPGFSGSGGISRKCIQWGSPQIQPNKNIVKKRAKQFVQLMSCQKGFRGLTTN